MLQTPPKKQTYADSSILNNLNEMLECTGITLDEEQVGHYLDVHSSW